MSCDTSLPMVMAVLIIVFCIEVQFHKFHVCGNACNIVESYAIVSATIAHSGWERMASKAFGSPIAFNTQGTSTVPTEQRSIGERLLRVVRGRLFEEEDPPRAVAGLEAIVGMVDLLGEDGGIVGVGVVDNSIASGVELHQVKLCPFKVAVHIICALDEIEWVGEVVGRLLSNCVGKVVRWLRTLVCSSRTTATASTSREGHNFSFPPISTPDFDFHDDEENLGNSQSTPRSHAESSARGRSSPIMQGLEGTNSNSTRDEGLLEGIP